MESLIGQGFVWNNNASNLRTSQILVKYCLREKNGIQDFTWRNFHLANFYEFKCGLVRKHLSVTMIYALIYKGIILGQKTTLATRVYQSYFKYNYFADELVFFLTATVVQLNKYLCSRRLMIWDLAILIHQSLFNIK